jgi:subtilisin family serine protease
MLRAPLPAGLVALLLSLLAPPAHAGAGRDLVVAFAPSPGATPGVTQAGLVPRLEALGLRAVASLADRVPALTSAARARSGRADGGSAPGTGPRGPAAGLPLDFDPARIWLFEATDSAAAGRALDSLRADPTVDWAEPDRLRSIAAFPTDGTLPDDPILRDGRQWGLRNLGPASPYGGLAGADIHALAAWARSVGSNDVLLAVADTGIDPAHPDLAGTLPDGSPRIAFGINVSGLEPADAYSDSFYHGTGVTGVMAARTNDGPHFDSLGIAGVCGGDGAANLGCRIVPIKITARHAGYASGFAIASAMLHAAAVGARAMNLSFAGDGPSRVERLAMQYAITHGCVVVAAAGNRGAPGDVNVQYPAAYAADGIGIQVGATDMTDSRVGWSSYGPDMDLMAPGLAIWTTFMTYPSAAGAVYDGYVSAAGTSFAAPFVTGTVGLLAAARPELIDTDFKHVLRESADDIGAPGVDAETGWGRLDAAAALAAVAPAIGIWHDEAAGGVVRPAGFDTLRVGEGGFGTLGHWSGRHFAERLEVTAVVALPDSFLGPVRAWPRIGGTSTVRGTWTLPYFMPWAEVEEWSPPGTALPAGARSFTLRGYVYHTVPDCADCADDAYVPLPPDQMRFGFTVLGPVDRPPLVAVLAPAAGDTLAPGDSMTVRWSATDPDEVSEVELDLVQDPQPPLVLARVTQPAGAATVGLPCAARPGRSVLRVTAFDEHGPQHDQAAAELGVVVRAGPCNGGPGARLSATPNPFRGPLRITGPAGTRVTIFDLAGRVLRAGVLDDGGRFAWDGRDGRGRAVAPGLYFARAGVAPRMLKLVRVE